jgi:regulator of sirC expression with transglutaminase-like and TPR domain
MRSRLALAIWFVALVPLCAQDDDEPLKPSQIAEVRRLIRALDADDFEDREAAAHQLWLLGPRTIPVLEDAAKDPSPEVRFRVAALLKTIRRLPMRASIEAFCALPDDQIDVEQGMWLMARILNPRVRQADLTRQLDEIAAKVRAKLGKDVDPKSTDPEQVVTALREVMFNELKFNTNKEDYDNPDNASPERVLATRKGRPVLVSHMVVAVARRLEVPIVGLPVSGMYCVKYDGARAPKGFSQDDIVFYPHENGRVLSREDRLKIFPNHDPDKLVPPATSRQALVRMLSNLTSLLDHAGADRADELQMANEMLQLLQRNEAESP